MALPGKENPFTRGLTESAPLPGIKTKKTFIKIPLSTGINSLTTEINSTNAIQLSDHPHQKEVATSAIGVSAIAEITQNRPKERQPERPILTPAIAQLTTAAITIAKNTTDGGIAKKATKVEYAIAKNTIADLADKKGGYTRVDNYVFDVILPTIGSAAAGIVYLYLWRRSFGFQKTSVTLSHQIIADAVGISKRTAQEAIARLNELNLIQTYRAYGTAIPEHFIQRNWTLEKVQDQTDETQPAMVNSAIADSATAETADCYSADCHSAIAESATIKRKVNKEIKKSLSQEDYPEAWIQFTSQLTEKVRERATRVYQSLRNQFPNDLPEEIAQCPTNLERFGAPDGTPWAYINSPVGLMESSWPQLREFFRKASADSQKLELAREQNEQERMRAKSDELRATIESETRKKAFFDAFPDEQERRSTIQKYLAGMPFKSDGLIAQGLAICKWWDEQNQRII